MKSLKWIAVGAGLTSVIPVAWMVWKPSLTAGVVCIAWAAAASIASAWSARKLGERRQQAAVWQVEQTAIQMLNHHRHDWMNELQILYGYIRLGKHDKSVQCVERIKERMQQDSKLSKLGIPSLVFYLHSYRTLNHSLQLEVEIVDHIQLDRLTPAMADNLTEAVIRTVNAFQQEEKSARGEDRLLTITFMQQEHELALIFEGDGPFDNPHRLKLQIEESLEGQGIRVEQTHPEEASYRLRLPFAT